MSETLPAPVPLEALAPEYADHRPELEALAERGWQFSRSQAGVFVARRYWRGTTTRVFARSVPELVFYLASRRRRVEPVAPITALTEGETPCLT